MRKKISIVLTVLVVLLVSSGVSYASGEIGIDVDRPDSVVAGDNFDMSFSVRNKSDRKADLDVYFEINDSQGDKVRNLIDTGITLEPRNSTKYQIDFPVEIEHKPEDWTYSLVVDGTIEEKGVHEEREHENVYEGPEEDSDDGPGGQRDLRPEIEKNAPYLIIALLAIAIAILAYNMSDKSG